MEMKRCFLKQPKQVGQSAHTVNAVGEYECSAHILAREVVQINVLLDFGAEQLGLDEVFGGDRLGGQVEHLGLLDHLHFFHQGVQRQFKIPL